MKKVKREYGGTRAKVKSKKGKAPDHDMIRGLAIKIRRRPTLPPALRAVPLALWGLTTVFGMGTGDPPRHSHRKTGRTRGPLRRGLVSAHTLVAEAVLDLKELTLSVL